MAPNSKLPSPTVRSRGNSTKLTTKSLLSSSKSTVPVRSKENPPSPAPHSKLPINNRQATLRQATSKLQPPSSLRNLGLNNNVTLRSSSRSSSTANPGNYSSIPSLTSVPRPSNNSSTSSNMLKIKLFTSNKDKRKKITVPSMVQSKNVKVDEKPTSNISKLVKPKTSSLKVPKQVSPSPNANASIRAMKAPALQQKDTLKSIRAKPMNLEFLSDGGAIRNKVGPVSSDQKRFSKNCNDISPQEILGSSSHTSSAESSSLSMNSASSKTSSLNCSEIKASVSSAKSLDTKILTTGTPPTSPSESKPTLAVKGISVTKVTFEESSGKTNISTTAENFRPQQIKTDDFISIETNNANAGETQAESVLLPSTSVLTPTSLKLINISQNPAIGVVSPMPSHRNSRAVSPHTSAGNQSDASTTSGSRDSDNASVIYNPITEKKQVVSGGTSQVENPKAPPVPVRTNSHLETTFDSNCSITTTELNSKSRIKMDDVSSIKMNPRPPPSYSEFLRKMRPEKSSAFYQQALLTDEKFISVNSSASEDSLDFAATNPCNSAHACGAGYLSDGDPLFPSENRVSELPVIDISNGYMSEGGITVYARKMQARFREGLEAVRDGMRNRQVNFNDSFEDSSSLSSGISENFDDISTDDLTASSLSDHPMTAAAAAYSKLEEYQQQHCLNRQLPPKRSVSASQGNSVLRLNQRRLHEQENIDQLLQKCRTSQRGIACNLQSLRYTDNGQHQLYRTLDTGHQMSQLTHGNDDDTICMRGSPTRSSLRISSKQDHQVQAGPGFSSMTGYHSLDRKAQFLSCYHSTDENPYKLAALDTDTSAATLALVSPRRVPNRQQLSLLQPSTDNRHSMAANRFISLSSGGMSRSVVLNGPATDMLAKTLTPSAQDVKVINFNRSKSVSKIVTGRIPLSVASQIPSIRVDTKQSKNGSSSTVRKAPAENIYANLTHKDQSLQLHKLSDDSTSRMPQIKTRFESGYLSSTSKTSPINSAEANGSHLSLTSSSGCTCSSVEEKYEAEIRKLNKEMESYRATITKLTEKHDGYNNLIQFFENKLNLMAKHLENLNGKSQLKKDEVSKLRAEIDSLRVISISTGIRIPSNGSSGSQLRTSYNQMHEGAGELLRQPSLESVNSHRSSMSSSSKGSKADKSSLNSFGKQGKKSWIRSSFTRAFTKGRKPKNGSVSDIEQSPVQLPIISMPLKSISGSTNKLNEIETVPQVVELKKQLEDKDSALTDVRLDALDKAREVDILKETINRLKTENKILKQNYNMLERRMRSESRASSQQSLPTLPDEDPVYEMPPSGDVKGVQALSNKTANCGWDATHIKVTVSVDFSGIFPAGNSSGEISIGGVPVPNYQVTWQQFDSQLFSLFNDYINRIDPDGALELHHKDSVIGYECGNFVRDILSNSSPSPLPANVMNQNTNIRMYLRGASQRGLDGLILECLFPKVMIDQLLSILLRHRRLVLFGATGIGKSNLARQLARYLSIRIGASVQDSIVDIKITDDDHDKAMAKVQKQLESLLRQSKMTIILIDNIQRHRIPFLSSTFSSVETPANEGPYVICTVNRASQLPEMQVHHDFRMFLLPNNVEAIKGYMGRFLRRRILESEFRDSEKPHQEIYRIIDFLPNVLAAVNVFIEKSNSRDVTIGSRLFLQCPLNVEKSREWFIKLWNQMIIPYMIKVAKEGVKVLGRCGSFEDPTDLVCEQWPWIDGPPAEQVLQRLSIKETISNQFNVTQFDPLEALMRIQSNNTNHQQEVA